ncbi:MAG: cofactor-independent phosphoglycerate mutase [Candidatus Omnitrophica bacterium]|nr:cofactor-independent phosphoglycerate mutase [Candidatus Omnitrophota bacterium]MCM8817814.1 cofactor-independent phosphoglycerate mutase [Candidatus Omnitrophota bacterium]
MKYLILVPDGAADYPLEELKYKTPLEYAYKPNIDFLTEKGCCGLMETIPHGFSAGSEVANLTILGYNPEKCYQGRGVLEAAALGINIFQDEVVFRCNTIFIDNDRIVSHSAGHISTEESRKLIEDLNKEFASEQIKFYPGLDYRHILILKDGFSPMVECFPPHDNIGRDFKLLLPKALTPQAKKTEKMLMDLIMNSRRILNHHPVNIKRINSGKQPANFIWPWSPGKKPDMELFTKKFGISGAVISAVDLIKGIGIYAGFQVINVPGATGLYNTNYEGKANAAIDALKKFDLVYVHVEAPDEAAHEGNVQLKIKCIEDFDERLVGTILKNIDLMNTTIAVIPDHYTPVSVRCHSDEDVPFVIYSPRLKPDNVKSFNEKSCSNGILGKLKGEQFIKSFLNTR